MNRIGLSVLLFVAGCSSAAEEKDRSLRDFRGAIHVHTLYSHDSSGTYEEILAAAKRVGLDFVVITDHPPAEDPGRPLRLGWRGLHDGVLFIQGAELRHNILAVGIREPVRGEGRPGRIDEIHRQGGVAIASHVEEIDDWDFAGCDGIEIFNIHTSFKGLQKDPKRFAEAIREFRSNPDEAWKRLCVPQKAQMEAWDRVSAVRRVAAVAGNDAHQNTFGLDPYWRSLGFVSTHVLATELTEEAILDGLRQGRTYVTFDGAKDLDGRVPRFPPE